MDISFNESRYVEEPQLDTVSNQRNQIVTQFLPSSGNLLEIGVWQGENTKAFLKKFKGNAYGMDLSLKIMEKAIPLFKEAKACDVGSDVFPWDDEMFDSCICTEVIEHIFDTDHMLIQIHRILKKEGVLVISTPNLSSFTNRILIGLFGWQPLATEVSCRVSNFGNPLRKSLKPAGHIRDFTYAAFRDIVESHGFTLEASRSIPIVQKQPFLFLEKFLSKRFPSLGGDMILKLRKK
jgi:2-polyprenyl-3-methyl-5-hydroxy-6-metoxy-1,4-benzoquinol methylase